jgi:small GTP-binding protein
MTILDKIKELETEMARTQKNKATEYHLGQLKAKLAKLRTQLLEGTASTKSEGVGFDVAKSGDARVALIGFPSVGKSTLLTKLTGTASAAAAYEFTTLTTIPGNIYHRGTKIQLLDLPGIIEGAAQGKGRGRQVIAVAKSSDLVLIVLDAAKESEKNHRMILENELETVGLRLNRSPPNIYFKKKKIGGIKFTATVPLTKLGDDPMRTVYNILHEYKIHNAELLFREDVSADDLIDTIEGNRKYVRVLYVWNKIDTVTIEDADRLAREPHSIVISASGELNLDRLVDKIWEYLSLTRIYTKKRGEAPDFTEPVVLTAGRYGITIESLCNQIHKSLAKDFKYALVWGSSTKHSPQHSGIQHVLHDEDVVQIMKRTVQEEMHMKDRAITVQEHWNEWKRKKKGAAPGEKRKPLKS